MEELGDSMIRVSRNVLTILSSKQRRKIFLIVCMMLLGGILESLSITLILPLVSAMLQGDSWRAKWYVEVLCHIFNYKNQREYVQGILFFLILAFIVKNAYLLYQNYYQNSFIAKSRFQMQKGLIISYTHKPYSYYLGSDSGEILRIVTQDTEQTFVLLSCLLRVYTELVISVVLGITIFFMSPQIAVWTMVLLLSEMLLISKVIKPVMRRMGEKGRSEKGAANKWILQIVHGIKSIKVSQTERFFEQNYESHAKNLVDVERKNATLENLPRLLIESFTVSGVLLIIYVIILSGAELSDILPQLSAFVVASIRLLPSSNRISSSLNMISYLEGALDNIIKIIDKEKQNDSFLQEHIEEEKKLSFIQDIRLEDLSFSYGNPCDNVLEHVYMKVKKGQSVGIIGMSGAGKSTCIDIILGLLKPQSGAVLVDGVNIETNLGGWLKNLAYIPQQIFLLNDTIRANVAFGIENECIKDEHVWQALREAQLEDYVKGLPDGLDSRVGEQGIRLSGGQRQRIGIARALYGNAEILFFDEATSALDSETELAIMEAIESLKGKTTMIIIAHRLTTIENCEVVYRVEDKKIKKVREFG